MVDAWVAVAIVVLVVGAVVIGTAWVSRDDGEYD